MCNIYIQESFVNETQNCRCGETDVYETFTDNKKELFKHLQKEHGACIGKVVVNENDTKTPIQIGWVFQKKCKYEDCNEYYIQSTWVTLHESEPIKTIKYNYL